ncbi:FIG028593: membrane protein [hydrothermal vent metagenome]|uniref:FIG028593: membrane protein n=1 Tax=hydrothermal vent metagenome TaxID=652676 RepID=A0A3B0UQI7_9ZZZZ
MQKATPQETAVSPKKQRTLQEHLGIVLRGIAMGASDIVPGVSGGTMAFILGIYEELIDSIRTIGRSDFIQAALKFRLKKLFQILNWEFLLAIVIGILIAVLTLSQALESLLINQPVYLWSFFFGLVLASVWAVSKRIKQWQPTLFGMLLLGAVTAYLIVGLVPVNTPNAWWFLILSGAIASSALILPGVSGAFLLVLLGKYQYVLGAVNDLRGGDWNAAVPLIFVGIGAALGLVTVSQFLSWLFKRYHDLTVALLIGLMVGSLRKIWPWKLDLAWMQDAAGQFILNSDGHKIVVDQANVLPDFSDSAGLTQFGIAVVLALIGIGAILLIDRLAAHQKTN